MNIYELSKEINTLKKSYKYKELLQFFEDNKNNFSKESIKYNKWIISNYLIALRKTNQNNKIDDFLNEYAIRIDENLDEIILNAYGWTLYDNLKNNHYSKNEIIQKLKLPIKLLFSKNSTFSYTIISNILREGLNFAKEQKDNNFLNQFCNLFDKNLLSEKENIFTIQNKTIIQASDKEKWYSAKSKALFELKKFKECAKISQEALDVIKKFHNNNELWFARRIALSKKEENINEAIKDLEKIYNRKKEWFIQKEIAELYFENNDIENAFKNTISSINAKVPIEFKIGVIFLLGKILKLKKEYLLAYKHFILIKNIREEKGWKIVDKLQNEINSFDFNESFHTKSLIKELKTYWTSFIPKKELLSGIITKILHNNEKGVNGFIKSNKKDYYFTLPKHLKISDKIAQNKKVEFEIIQINERERAKIIKVLE